MDKADKKNARSVKKASDPVICPECGIANLTRLKGEQKVWNYFLDLIRTDSAQTFIKKLKKKYGIPAEGFALPDKNILGAYPDDFEHAPEVGNKLVQFCDKHHLNFFVYVPILEQYVYYGLLSPETWRTWTDDDFSGYLSMFCVTDVPRDNPTAYKGEKILDTLFPVAIRISPYASQRDLLDFIKNKHVWYNKIESLQKQYRDKDEAIGKSRTKNKEVQKRNDFIYKHRNLPRREIMRLLIGLHKENKRVWEIDEAAISKVISLEKKKRKDVSS